MPRKNLNLNGVNENNFLGVKQKKCEIPSTTNKVINAHIDLPKSHISEENISAPRGCCTPKILHAPENNQVLLV